MVQSLHIPSACKVNNVIFKKLFYENGDLSVSDKKIFTDVIDKITWVYSLKEENCFIHPYKDEVREYPEIEIIEVQLHSKAKEKRIAELIMRTIPYPMLLVLRFEEQAQLWVAHQRNSQNDSEKNVLEELIATAWLDTAEIAELFVKLNFDTLQHTNFYALYTDIVDGISVCNAHGITASEGLTGEQAREILKKQEQLEAQLTALRSQLKKETQFNRKVELSMEIKKLEKERK